MFCKARAMMEPCHFKMHPEMSRAIIAIARERDVTVGQILRDLVAAEIRRHHDAKPPIRADERLIAPLRARLANCLAHPETWDAVQAALRSKGYELRAAGGGLALHAHPSGARICKASELGFSYARLMRRIGAPFPGHPHAWLFDKQKAEADESPCLIETDSA